MSSSTLTPTASCRRPSAKDKASGKEQKIRIEASSGLSDADIDKMVKQAEANAKEDQGRRDQVKHNQLDGLEAEKDSKEWVDRLRGRRQGAAQQGRGGRQGGTADGEAEKIRSALDELNITYSAAVSLLPERPVAEAPGHAGSLRTRQPRPTRSWTTPPSRNRTVRPGTFGRASEYYVGRAWGDPA